MSRGGGMEVVIGGKGIGGDGVVVYERINSDSVGYHCGVYSEPPNL